MYLVDKCKKCGQFTYLGYTNEFEERFCSKECYEHYCKKNNFPVDFSKLKTYNGAKQC